MLEADFKRTCNNLTAILIAAQINVNSIILDSRLAENSIIVAKEELGNINNKIGSMLAVINVMQTSATDLTIDETFSAICDNVYITLVSVLNDMQMLMAVLCALAENDSIFTMFDKFVKEFNMSYEKCMRNY